MILCGGDALIDFVPVIEPDGGTGFVPRVGGAILNAATALRRLGEDVSFVGALSSAMFGDANRGSCGKWLHLNGRAIGR